MLLKGGAKSARPEADPCWGRWWGCEGCGEGFPGRNLSRVWVNIYLPNLSNGIIRSYSVGNERLDKTNYKYQNCVFFN